MKAIFRRLLFGDAEIKEFSTVTTNGEVKEKVYLEVSGKMIDVSADQFLLCLDPIVFGIWTGEKEDIPIAEDSYHLYFTCSTENIRKNAFAHLALSLFDKIEDDTSTLLLLKYNSGEIHHVNSFKAQLLYSRFYKKENFTFEQLKALASAYSYPRRVKVVSFKQNDYYNIFPMDLLGDISESGRYVLGLRHTNTALPKIIETKKIVVSEVSYNHKDAIYKLGSHHSKTPPSTDLLPFKVVTSERFGFYLPEWVDTYKEIAITKTMDLGSHMLLWGEVQNECVLRSSLGHLFHIHYLLYLYQKRKGLLYTAV